MCTLEFHFSLTSFKDFNFPLPKLKFPDFSPTFKKFFSFLRGTQSQFSESICSEDDLRPRIFGTFVVKFLLPCLS